MAHNIIMISDPVCPWCMIGYHRLHMALQATGAQADITFEPFELNPTMPETGMPRKDYVQQKFGAQGKAFYANITATAAADGLDLNLDKIQHMPSTRRIHRLVAWLKSQHPDKITPFMLALFQGFFQDGQKIDDDAFLRKNLATLDINNGIEQIQGNAFDAEVTKYRKYTNNLEVSGVPFFIINHQQYVPGAITAQAWQKILV